MPRFAPPNNDPQLAMFLNQPPDPARPYVYPGTNIRINKFGMLNPPALDQVVRTTSSLRAEILRMRPIAGSFDLEHLCEIHRYLFQDVYPWAGEIRVVDFDRSDDPFTKPGRIVVESNEVLSQLAAKHHLRGLAQYEFADQLAYFIDCLYSIHPFRDGNGRSVRAFFEQLARERGFQFTLGSVSQNERHSSAHEAHQGNKEALRNLIHSVTIPIVGANPQ
jgi:cell filamentation protein